MSVDISKLKSAAKKYLTNAEDLSKISLKTMRLDLENWLNLPQDTLLTKKFNEILVKCIKSNLTKVQSNKNLENDNSKPKIIIVKPKDDDNDDDSDYDEQEEAASKHTTNGNGEELKKGRFSADETKLILDTCKNYMETHNIDVTMLISSLRMDVNGNPLPALKNKDFWDTVYSLFPNRNTQAVYRKVRSELMHGDGRGTWNQEDAEILSNLVRFLDLLSRSSSFFKLFLFRLNSMDITGNILLN